MVFVGVISDVWWFNLWWVFVNENFCWVRVNVILGNLGDVNDIIFLFLFSCMFFLGRVLFLIFNTSETVVPLGVLLCVIIVVRMFLLGAGVVFNR